MAWYYWVLIAIVPWYIAAALVIRRFGTAGLFCDENWEEAKRNDRVATWILSPILVVVAGGLVLIGLPTWCVVWPLKKWGVPLFDRFLKPKV
jgi:hypothetical protein